MNALILIVFLFPLFFVGRLLDVCHGQLERERQLVLFLVFEHLEEDLAGYLNRMGDRGMAPKTIQVTWPSVQCLPKNACLFAYPFRLFVLCCHLLKK